MPYCAVANCKSHSGVKNQANADVSYYGFPTDTELREKWISATGREDWSPVENSVICSKHFDDKVFISGTNLGELPHDATPTKNLPIKDQITIDSDNSEESEKSEDESMKFPSGPSHEMFLKAQKTNNKQKLMIRKLQQQHQRNLKKIKLQNRVLNDLMEIYNLKHGDIAILRTEIMKSEEFKRSCQNI